MQGLQLHWLQLFGGGVVACKLVVGRGVVVVVVVVVGLGVVVVVVVVVVIGTQLHGMQGQELQGLHGWQLLFGCTGNTWVGGPCVRVLGHCTLGHVWTGPSHLI